MKNFIKEDINTSKLRTFVSSVFTEDYKLVEIFDNNKAEILSSYKGLFEIKPNYFKNNYKKAFVKIDRRTRIVTIEGNNLNDRMELFDKFEKEDIETNYLLSVFNMVMKYIYEYSIYVPYKNSNYNTAIEKLLSESDDKTDLYTYFNITLDVIGTGNSNDTRDKEIQFSKCYRLDDNFKLVADYKFSFPLKAKRNKHILIFKLMKVDGEYKIVFKAGENSTEVKYKPVESLKKFEHIINQEFLNIYKDTIKKCLNIESNEYDEEYVKLLRIVRF